MTVHAFSSDPYNKYYDHNEIYNALLFYFNMSNDLYPGSIFKNREYIDSKNIQICLNFLKAIDKDSKITNFRTAHPLLELYIERIDKFKKQNEELYESKIISALIMLIDTGITFMIVDAKYRINSQLQKSDDPSSSQDFLVESKFWYQQNPESFPSKFITNLTQYIDLELDKQLAKSKLQVHNNDQAIYAIIENALNSISEKTHSNDLESSLINNDIDEFCGKLKRVLYIPSYHDFGVDDLEKTFHMYTLGVLAGKLNQYNIKSNKESGLGRYDIQVKPYLNTLPALIIEIKKIQKLKDPSKEVRSALNQINDNKYAVELKNEGIEIIYNIAIVFNGKEPIVDFEECKNI